VLLNLSASNITIGKAQTRPTIKILANECLPGVTGFEPANGV
jgi:hypothetical protein